MPFIRANDAAVYYEFAGPSDAPVVMLANSLGTNVHVWDAVVPELAATSRLLRFDMRGHGLGVAERRALRSAYGVPSAVCQCPVNRQRGAVGGLPVACPMLVPGRRANANDAIDGRPPHQRFKEH